MKATYKGMEVEGTPQEIAELMRIVEEPKTKFEPTTKIYTDNLFKNSNVYTNKGKEEQVPKRISKKEFNEKEFIETVTLMISQGRTLQEIDHVIQEKYGWSKANAQKRRSDLGLTRNKYLISKSTRSPSKTYNLPKHDGRKNKSKYNMFMKKALTDIHNDDRFKNMHSDEKFLLAVNRWRKNKQLNK